MQKKDFRSLFLCLTLCLAAVLGGVLIPSSAAALQQSECGAIRELANSWFYVPSTVPEGIEVVEWSDWTDFDYYDQKTDQFSTEMGLECTITFVKGDEALKDALQYKQYTTSFSSGGVMHEDFPMLDLYVDNAQLTAPGTAVFRVKIKSEHCTQDAEVTLRVLSWDEQPLFEPVDTGEAVNVQIGDILEERQIASLTMKLHDEEIIEALTEQGAKGLTLGVVNEFVQLSERNSDTGFLARWNNNSEVEQGYATGQFVQYRSGYEVKSYGSGTILVRYKRGNIKLEKEVSLVAAGYKIDGPGLVKPGETAQYEIISAPKTAGRTFACFAEGEGVTLNPDTLLLSVAEGTPEGTEFRIIATPSDGGEPAVLEGRVGSGLIALEEFEAIPLYEGFSMAMPVDQAKYGRSYLQENGETYCVSTDQNAPYNVVISYVGYAPMDEFAEDPDVANSIYDSISWDQLNVSLDERIDKDGHPVRIVIGRWLESGRPAAVLEYARNNRYLRAWVMVFEQNGTAPGDLPDVSAEDMKKLAAEIVYDPAEASIIREDGEITLTNKEETTLLTAGKKLVLKAEFANPDRVNRKAKNDTLEWLLTDTETGAEPEGFKLDGKSGTLSAPRNLEKVYQLEIKASSPIFHTEAVYPVTVLPAVTKIYTDPADLTFYAGTDTAETVLTVLEPDTVPLIGIAWTLKKEGIVEMTPGENGSAAFKPVAAGKTSAVVSEPGGKKAELKISVIEPVAEVQLAVSGNPAPGRTVSVKATVLPKNAGIKDVEWSLDVGEDVATINKGQVIISKEASVGTRITVTCTAPGAPEPVLATAVIEVAEK